MRVLILLGMLAGLGTAKAEVSCFRTPAQAAVQVGEQEGGGYRLEFVRLDAVGGKSWATVRSCVHPEWPSVVVAAKAGTASSEPAHVRDDKTVANMGHPAVSVAVVGGRRVTVVEVAANVRMEMSGVAQGSGRVGELVWVRILAPGGDGEGRMAQAVVRSADVLEIGQ